MNPSINNRINPNPQLQEQQRLANVAQQQPKGGEVKLSSRSEADSRTGASQGKSEAAKTLGKTTIGQRFQTSLTRKRKKDNLEQSEKMGGEEGIAGLSSLDSGDSEDDTGRRRQSSSEEVIEMLKAGGGSLKEQFAAVTDKLKDRPPMERYSVLFAAYEQADDKELKNKLQDMMSEYHEKDSAGIRRGLTGDDSVSPIPGMKALAELAGAGAAQLRSMLVEKKNQLKAKAKVKPTQDLVPSGVIRAGIKHFTKELAEAGLESITSRMMQALRKATPSKMAAYEEARRDASVMLLVKSGFKASFDLKVNLDNKAKTLPKMQHTEIAEILFNACEMGWGKGKASQLVNQIVDLGAADPYRKGVAYSVVWQAVSDLPPTAWPQEKLPNKKELLDDLKSLSHDAHGEIPQQTSKEEQLEDRLRSALYAKMAQRKQMPQNSR